MRYAKTVKGRFLSRPNRFIAMVELHGAAVVCHVKNTGRCRELLTAGAEVILSQSDNPTRKTAYDLIAVYKNGMLINMDSQAPNAAFGEWVRESGYFGELTLIRPECVYGDSRFDFYLEAKDRKIFVEVKGVTLEEDGVVRFPDAPTERGIKHLRELIRAVKNGYDAYVFFVIQMESCRWFEPNAVTHEAFAKALREASAAGVAVRAVCCHVEEGSMALSDFAEVRL